MRMFQPLLFVLLLVSVVFEAGAQSSVLTYQGRINHSGQPFNGSANLQFLLFDAAVGGSQLGTTQFFPGTVISEGLFQVELDFGSSAFDGTGRYLEIQVNGAPLNPRQPVRAAPVALFALDGNEGPQGPAGPPGAQGATGLQGIQGPPGSSPFQLDASGGGFQYQHIDSLFRFNAAHGGNIYGGGLVIGHAINEASGIGAAVLGGGRKTGTSDFANIASANNALVAGGDGNRATGLRSSVIGGHGNTASGLSAAVFGGERNTAAGPHAIVLGGVGNTALSYGSIALGRQQNCAGGLGSFAGGNRAKVRVPASATDLGEGCQDVPVATGAPNGDTGTFVWSGIGTGSADFVSSGAGQFLVMAPGGALFTNDPSVNSPQGSRLRVNGTLRVDSLGSGGSDSLCRNASNQLATCSSSARYKQDIRALEPDPEVLMALRPVRYRWIDSRQEDIGLVAEEVAALIPELATYNEQGLVEGLKYDRLTAWLITALQAQQSDQQHLHRQVDELRRNNAVLRTLAADTQSLREENRQLTERLAMLETLVAGDRALTEVPR